MDTKNTEEIKPIDTFKQELESSADSYSFGASKIQERRHPEWNVNYQLYRLKVSINRLTQRQSTVIPLMKETIKTGLSKHKFADLSFSSRVQDDQEELDFNEYWNHVSEFNNFYTLDKTDTKQEALYGRSFIKMGIAGGEIVLSVEDPVDVVIDQFSDPANISGTANFFEHRHIYRSFSYIKGNQMYDPVAVQELEDMLKGTENKIIPANQVVFEAKVPERTNKIGQVPLDTNEVGDVFVELREQYIRKIDKADGKLHIFIRVVAEGKSLFLERLDKYLGIDFIPFITWASDVERTDIWSDGVGDIVRVPNMVLNSWLSQLVENRTLRNLGMYFYDQTANESWMPQTYDPVAWGWYGVPGKPSEVAQRFDVPDLSESLDEMNFLITTVERATAATAMEKGISEAGQMTLGEIKIITQNADDRFADSVEMRKRSRLELGRKLQEFIIANKDNLNPVVRYKKGFDGKVYEANIDPKTFNKKGFEVEVEILDEKKTKDIQNLQKMQGVLSMFPNNMPLKKYVQNKALNIIDGMTPDEKSEIIKFQEIADKQMAEANANPNTNVNTGIVDKANPVIPQP